MSLQRRQHEESSWQTKLEWFVEIKWWDTCRNFQERDSLDDSLVAWYEVWCSVFINVHRCNSWDLIELILIVAFKTFLNVWSQFCSVTQLKLEFDERQRNQKLLYNVWYETTNSTCCWKRKWLQCHSFQDLHLCHESQNNESKLINFSTVYESEWSEFHARCDT